MAHLARHVGDRLVVVYVFDLGRHDLAHFAAMRRQTRATARITMSRSLNMPTSRSFSPTGSAPKSFFSIRLSRRFAADRQVRPPGRRASLFRESSSWQYLHLIEGFIGKPLHMITGCRPRVHQRDGYLASRTITRSAG